MIVCKVWDADYPWDIRVEKVCDVLTASGHDVHLVCRNQARRPRSERQGRLFIHRLPALNPAIGPLHTLWNLPFPVNPIWFSEIAKTIIGHKADVILVRDILLAPPCVLLGKLFGIPVILDMAENYPAMLRDRLRYTPTTLLGKVIRNPVMARFVEKLCLRTVDYIIVVVEESKQRLIRAGVSENRIGIVNNTPRTDRWRSNQQQDKELLEGQPAKMIYLGNLDGSRGLDVVVGAIRLLKDRNLPGTITVIGNGPNLLQLVELAERQHVSDRIQFTGRIPFSRVEEIIRHSNIGVIPHYATEAWKTTIPNKLFDYMAVALPVIVSDGMPMSRVVREESCGLVFRDQDPHDLADCIKILSDPELRKRYGLQGRNAVLKRFNWEQDSKILLHAINSNCKSA